MCFLAFYFCLFIFSNISFNKSRCSSKSSSYSYVISCSSVYFCWLYPPSSLSPLGSVFVVVVDKLLIFISDPKCLFCFGGINELFNNFQNNQTPILYIFYVYSLSRCLVYIKLFAKIYILSFGCLFLCYFCCYFVLHSVAVI